VLEDLLPEAPEQLDTVQYDWRFTISWQVRLLSPAEVRTMEEATPRPDRPTQEESGPQPAPADAPKPAQRPDASASDETQARVRTFTQEESS
jgi:hypothetical protein